MVDRIPSPSQHFQKLNRHRRMYTRNVDIVFQKTPRHVFFNRNSSGYLPLTSISSPLFFPSTHDQGSLADWENKTVCSRSIHFWCKMSRPTVTTSKYDQSIRAPIMERELWICQVTQSSWHLPNTKIAQYYAIIMSATIDNSTPSLLACSQNVSLTLLGMG